MKIVKAINNNAALALDQNGKELVVFGRGIGFHSAPYELTDLSRIERTFYDVSPQYFDVVGELPQSILLASADIAEQAEFELDCDLNPNLPFTLADHLNFAIERRKKGIQITTPLAYDIAHLYPREYALGKAALKTVFLKTGVRLPDDEAVNVALHLINAETESGDMTTTMTTAEILTDVDRIISQQLGITPEPDSFYYSRFTMHLRYLIQRMSDGEQLENMDVDMLQQLAREHPKIYHCTQEIADYFKRDWYWTCTNEELLYLMMHIYRLSEKSS